MTGPVLTTVLGTDLVVWLAVGLALAGVVGSLVPLVPGALLSLGGVYLYWWSTGYVDPGLLVLGALTLLGLLIVVIDWFAGAVSAKVSGAGNLTTVIAGVAGFLLFFVAGPFGILAGVASVVFLSELQRTGDTGSSARTAVYTTVGMLASTVAQFLLTTLLVLGFLLAVLI
ncbi:hypothetical protein BV210_01255 [Halorientalis sp. IM1011]|uniref:DUF456 domain-containing protein n=1 Tax=Halorientalis sp. IM1011 TaxID=1932360 RepID=UPI00097CC633|nr:DUF456 domain-containing protein [Halorientalis sp. IM1011]AQL41423.1 hypothetical protein BV210_01255 [Halorientalis sp. IM1011]